MKKTACSLLLCLTLSSASAQTHNFSVVDSLFDANRALFNGKVVCMLKHNDTLIYYKEMGGIDSTSNGLIASVSKTFAGITILKLAQEGLLTLDDSLGMYKPRATTLGKGATTIRQNFSHTGGWFANTTFHADNRLNLQQAVDSIIEYDPFIYIPGQKFKYSGVSMHTSGAIAEIVTGQDWNTIFSTSISSPLNLNNSFFCLGQNNPRIAGGMCSNPSDLMKLGDFIAKNGRNNLGVQVIDSLWMSELWKDQTNRAPQLTGVYPYNPANNNPYNADTIYYGFGNWLDIYNPNTQYQEQISADGAFGSVVWVNRCTNMTGVIFTKIPTRYTDVFPLWYQIMDVFRNSVPNTCSGVLDVDKIGKPTYNIYPNPSQGMIHIEGPKYTIRKIKIFSLSGQLLGEKYLTNDENTISISELADGFYVLKIETNKQAVFKKIVLRR